MKNLRKIFIFVYLVPVLVLVFSVSKGKIADGSPLFLTDFFIQETDENARPAPQEQARGEDKEKTLLTTQEFCFKQMIDRGMSEEAALHCIKMMNQEEEGPMGQIFCMTRMRAGRVDCMYKWPGNRKALK